MPKRLANILQSAIEEELQAYEYYTSLSQSLPGEELKNLFAALASEEMSHRDTLQTLLDNKQYPEIDYAFEMPVESAEHLPPLTALLKPQDGLALAIAREEIARRDYLFLASISTSEKQKKVFEGLASMEKGHKEKLERILQSGNLPEQW